MHPYNSTDMVTDWKNPYSILSDFHLVVNSKIAARIRNFKTKNIQTNVWLFCQKIHFSYVVWYRRFRRLKEILNPREGITSVLFLYMDLIHSTSEVYLHYYKKAPPPKKKPKTNICTNNYMEKSALKILMVTLCNKNFLNTTFCVRNRRLN